MKVASGIFAGLLVPAFLLSTVFLVSVIIYQLFSGKSLVRLKPRQDSRMWFWFTTGFELTIALLALYVIFLAVFRTYV